MVENVNLIQYVSIYACCLISGVYFGDIEIQFYPLSNK